MADATAVPPIRTAALRARLDVAPLHAAAGRPRPAPRPRPRSGPSSRTSFPDDLDNFLQFRIADLTEDPAAQPWLGRAIVLTEPDGTRRIDRVGRVPRAARRRRPRRDRLPGRAGVPPPGRRDRGGPRPVRLGARPAASIASGRRSRPTTSPSLAIIRGLGFRQIGVQIDDIDGEELVFELDGWPPARLTARYHGPDARSERR